VQRSSGGSGLVRKAAAGWLYIVIIAPLQALAAGALHLWHTVFIKDAL
jgi:hypothetical protein